MNTTTKRLPKALVSGALFALVAPAVAPITGPIELVSPRAILAGARSGQQVIAAGDCLK